MYCWNCGKKNPDDNQFCGACGKRLAAREETTRAGETLASPPPPTLNEPRVERVTQSVAPPPQTNPLVEEPRVARESFVPEAPARVATQEVRERDNRRISGPSFLGLSDESTENNSDYDYLLEEEQPRSSWRAMLAIILLALIALLIYKQWSVVSASTRNLAERAGIVKEEQTAPADPSSQPETKAATNPPPNVSEGDLTVNDDQTPTAAPPADTPLSEKDPAEPAKPAPGPPATPEEKELDQAQTAPTGEAPTPDENPTVVSVDNSQVELAQKYLQGRGVAQDCARGVSLLRSAAGKMNPRAQIQLGALYATGHCVTQDKAAAYRWFSQAQELDPDNSYINRNLNSLWASMSGEERRRAERE